jgi:hypothetical protein
MRAAPSARTPIEGHTLALGELIKAPLRSAAMEKPFLSSIVANETEAAIPNEPFDGSAWHGRAPFRSTITQSSAI